MSEQREEQEMEAEALTAIFDTQFTIIQGEAQPFVWKIDLWPEANIDDDTAENHVGITIQVTLPTNYPEDDTALPEISIDILKGLTDEHANNLQQLAIEEAQNNAGVPSIFAICERLREWLVEHNQKGHDDVSMHAQMLRRKKEAELKEQQLQQRGQRYESQKAHDEMTQAEREELELRRKRAEGTPVTPETFEAWKQKFEEEMRLLKETEAKEEELNNASGGGGKKKSKSGGKGGEKDDHKKGRLTGFQQFSDKAFNLEALEAAAENAQTDPDEDEDEDDYHDDNDNDENDNNIKEELFDVDDEDLDDLDFDDEDEDDEEDVDI